MSTLTDDERGVKIYPKNTTAQARDGYGSIGDQTVVYHVTLASSTKKMNQSKMRLLSIIVLTLVLGLMGCYIFNAPYVSHKLIPNSDQDISTNDLISNSGIRSKSFSASTTSTNDKLHNDIETRTDTNMVTRIQSANSCIDDLNCEEFPDTPFCFFNREHDHTGYCQQCVAFNQCGDFEECHNNRCREVRSNNPPGFDQQEIGYDVYNADPFNGEGDPGFKVKQLFEQRRSVHLKTTALKGKTFDVPSGYDISIGTSGCRKTTESDVITSTSSFQTDMSKVSKVKASGKIKGVNIGGGIGASSYKSVYESSMKHLKTVKIQNVCILYSFEMHSHLEDGTPHTLMLTNPAKARIMELPPVWDDKEGKWDNFFSDYGTHITTKGSGGASKRMSYTLTSSEIKKVVKEKESLEASFNAAMPGIFSMNASTSKETMTVSQKTIMNSSSKKNINTKGNADELLTSSVLIEKELSSFCEFLDYEEIENFNMTACYKSTEKYCVKVLEEAGFEGIDGKCEIPGYIFTCVFDSDCPGSERCWDMMCTEPKSSGCDLEYSYFTEYQTGCAFTGISCEEGFSLYKTYTDNCFYGWKNNECRKSNSAVPTCPHAPWKGEDNWGFLHSGREGCYYTKSTKDGISPGIMAYTPYGTHPTFAECKKHMTQDTDVTDEHPISGSFQVLQNVKNT